MTDDWGNPWRVLGLNARRHGGLRGSGDGSLLNGGTALVKVRYDLSSATSLNASSFGSPSREGSPDPDALDGSILPSYTTAQLLPNQLGESPIGGFV